MKNFFLITTLLIVSILQSCTREPFQDERDTSKSKINIKLDTKALELAGTSVSKVRIIAYHKGKQKIMLNTTSLTDQSTVQGEGLFSFKIPLGEYSFYAIVNELDNLTDQLDAIDSESALNLIKIQPVDPFTETTVMLTKKKDVTIDVDGSEQTTVDGAVAPLVMELERVYTKVSLKINKETVNPTDKFTIKSVDFVQSPIYSYLNAKIYDGTLDVSREIFKGAIEFTTNGDESVIVKEITAGTSAEPSNIFAEYLLADTDKSTHDKASYLGVLASYTPDGGSSHDVYYKIPVGDYKGVNAVDGAGHDYNLNRNYHYAINAKITKMGEKDAVEIEYTVEPWKNEKLNIEIEGDPFLDVSNVEVNVYDAAATRIYFYSNMVDVTIDPMLLNGTQSIAVNDIFDGLTGMAPTNFKYIYNPDTKRGEGYLDLININTENSVRQQRKLYLKSGKLVREITAMTRISAEAAKNNVQPFVGTFHRYTERDERIVSWHLPTTTKWKVEIVADNSFDAGVAGASYYEYAKSLRIDHLASPNHDKLYTLEPPSAVGAYVMEEIEGSVKKPITKIEGRGRVYFRVGWADVLKLATDHRFAKIKVTTSTDDFNSNNEVRYLYCRQGEDPVPIVSNSTLFASYNISTPEKFVDFPTQSGYLYQWNRTVPWAVTGEVNNYLKGNISDVNAANEYNYKTYDSETYICPAKYSYPDNKALTVMHTALNPNIVMYQWGYYADGFFDRRAVSENMVRNAVGEIASAGGLFFSGTTAVAIFLPTVSWRDFEGKINNLPPHQDMGVIGHYWSLAQNGEWTAPPNTGAPVLTATLEAFALHLTRNASPDSYLEALNKASAASVRCMKLEGKTVYFDSNGGQATPRSMTVEKGSITFPDGPKHTNPVFGFVDWASARGGSATTYKAGVSEDIDIVGDKTWYAQYKRLGNNINGKILVLSEPDASVNINYNQAYNICDAATIDGYDSWRLPTVLEMPLLHKAVIGFFPSGKRLWALTDGGFYYTSETPFAPPALVVKRDASYTANTMVRCVREII